MKLEINLDINPKTSTGIKYKKKNICQYNLYLNANEIRIRLRLHKLKLKASCVTNN